MTKPRRPEQDHTESIRQLVAAAPPATAEQRARLRALLGPQGDAAATSAAAFRVAHPSPDTERRMGIRGHTSTLPELLPALSRLRDAVFLAIDEASTAGRLDPGAARALIMIAADVSGANQNAIARDAAAELAAAEAERGHSPERLPRRPHPERYELPGGRG